MEVKYRPCGHMDRAWDSLPIVKGNGRLLVDGLHLMEIFLLFHFNRKVEDNPKLKEFIEKENITINMTETELKGPERFAADNILTDEECDALIRLANVSFDLIGQYSSDCFLNLMRLPQQ
jgi:hypothetical protein